MAPPDETVVRDDRCGLELRARVQRVGADLVIVIGGGGSPHVGCVVLAQPTPSRTRPGEWSPSCSVLTIPPHKEEPIARVVAEAVCRATGAVVVVSAGVHDDGLDRAGIESYLRLGEDLAGRLMSVLG
jgi:hypothetical protein